MDVTARWRLCAKSVLSRGLKPMNGRKTQSTLFNRFNSPSLLSLIASNGSSIQAWCSHVRLLSSRTACCVRKLQRVVPCRWAKCRPGARKWFEGLPLGPFFLREFARNVAKGQGQTCLKAAIKAPCWAACDMLSSNGWHVDCIRSWVVGRKQVKV